MNHKTPALLTLLLIAGTACGSATETTATVVPTSTVVPTATEDSSIAMTAAANAEARARIEQVAPTSAAEEAAVQAFIQANIAPDLELTGYSTEVGALAWGPLLNVDFELSTKQPINVVHGFLDDPNPSFTNFVFAADVDWESEPGISGCGILFHGKDAIDIDTVDDFTELHAFRYFATFQAIRLSGQPHWNMELEESGSMTMISDVKINSAINLGQGSTNHFVLSVAGLTVTAYANGERLGDATLPASLSQGQIALEAFHGTGLNATCIFDNLWVWELPE